MKVQQPQDPRIPWDEIPRADPPKWARCPVCREISPWELRTCPTCPGVLLLAIYIGDYLPARFRKS